MLMNPLDRAVRYRDGIPVLPGAFPLLGHVPSIYHDALELLRWGRDALGPLFWMVIGPSQLAVTYTERDSLELLKNRTTTNTFLKDYSSVLVGESLLGQDGKLHQHMRTAMNGLFTPRGLAESGVGSVLADLFVTGVDRWAARRKITILTETQELALSAIFRIIGIDVADLPTWRAQYRDFVYSVSPLPAWLPGSPTRRAMRARTWLDEQLSQLIQIERSRPMGKSFFNALVNGRDDEGKAMSDSDLVDNLRLLTFAGHETTASVLAWVVITLASRPELWQRLCDEVDKGASMPTSPQDLRAFPFAEALFRETLRVYPIVAMTGRKTTTEVTIAHHRVPSGVLVNIPLSLLMRDPEIFPEPSRFDPDRWLGRREPPTLLEIAQFGGGPHFCLGYHLALMESVQLLVALAQRMAKDGLRPRLADGKAPQHRYLPLGHPTGATVIDFV